MPSSSQSCKHCLRAVIFLYLSCPFGRCTLANVISNTSRHKIQFVIILCHVREKKYYKWNNGIDEGRCTGAKKKMNYCTTVICDFHLSRFSAFIWDEWWICPISTGYAVIVLIICSIKMFWDKKNVIQMFLKNLRGLNLVISLFLCNPDLFSGRLQYLI